MLKKMMIIIIAFTTLLFGVPFVYNDTNFFSVLGLGNDKSVEFKDSFRLKLSETEEIIELNAEEYIIGCLFAQIPISYHPEALKAQAIAAFTYAVRVSYDNEIQEESEEFDVTDDPVTCQPFFTETAARDYYGEEYDTYYEKVKSAAEYGTKIIIEYEGLPIYSVFHGVSAGVTNTSDVIWGRKLPYLQSVDSNWDKEYYNFQCVNEFTVSNMRSMLIEYNSEINMPVDYNLWFQEITKNSAGYVESVLVGGSTILGGDMWRIFSLRSTDFTVRYTGSGFEFTTNGYGHGAGMSQYGADYMAGQGSGAEEILLHYYTGVKLRSR